MIETKNPSIRDEGGRIVGAADGPWNREPDRVEFETEGLSCLLRRVPNGSWCGYVALPPGHHLHGVGGWDLPSLDVHGGITYAEACHGEVCHVPKPGETDDVWWLGFDTGHHGDLVPAWSWTGGTYRDLEYVRFETRRLAMQLAT